MSRTRSITLLTLATAAALGLAGCTATTGDAGQAPESTDDEAGTVSFTWDRNTAGEEEDPAYESTTVEVPKNPETIVVFDMASLDTLGALGGEATGAPLDSVPDYLEDALSDDAFNAGTLFEADLLEIEAAQPDLIIIGGRSAALYDDLSQIAPTVDLGLNGGFIETLERNVTFLAEVLGAEDEAEGILTDITDGIDQAKAATADIGTGLGIMVSGGKVSAQAPAAGDTSGRATRGGLIYDVFGVTPAVDDVKNATHGEPISFEFLLEHDPDFLWVVDRDAATGEEGAKAAEAVLDNDIVAQTTAAKNDQIVYLNPTAWYIVFGGVETTQLMIDDVLQIAE